MPTRTKLLTISSPDQWIKYVNTNEEIKSNITTSKTEEFSNESVQLSLDVSLLKSWEENGSISTENTRILFLNAEKLTRGSFGNMQFEPNTGLDLYKNARVIASTDQIKELITDASGNSVSLLEIKAPITRNYAGYYFLVSQIAFPSQISLSDGSVVDTVEKHDVLLYVWNIIVENVTQKIVIPADYDHVLASGDINQGPIRISLPVPSAIGLYTESKKYRLLRRGIPFKQTRTKSFRNLVKNLNSLKTRILDPSVFDFTVLQSEDDVLVSQLDSVEDNTFFAKYLIENFKPVVNKDKQAYLFTNAEPAQTISNWDEFLASLQEDESLLYMGGNLFIEYSNRYPYLCVDKDIIPEHSSNVGQVLEFREFKWLPVETDVRTGLPCYTFNQPQTLADSGVYAFQSKTVDSPHWKTEAAFSVEVVNGSNGLERFSSAKPIPGLSLTLSVADFAEDLNRRFGLEFLDGEGIFWDDYPVGGTVSEFEIVNEADVLRSICEQANLGVYERFADVLEETRDKDDLTPFTPEELASIVGSNGSLYTDTNAYAGVNQRVLQNLTSAVSGVYVARLMPRSRNLTKKPTQNVIQSQIIGNRLESQTVNHQKIVQEFVQFIESFQPFAEELAKLNEFYTSEVNSLLQKGISKINLKTKSKEVELKKESEILSKLQTLVSDFYKGTDEEELLSQMKLLKSLSESKGYINIFKFTDYFLNLVVSIRRWEDFIDLYNTIQSNIVQLETIVAENIKLKRVKKQRDDCDKNAQFYITKIEDLKSQLLTQRNENEVLSQEVKNLQARTNEESESSSLRYVGMRIGAPISNKEELSNLKRQIENKFSAFAKDFQESLEESRAHRLAVLQRLMRDAEPGAPSLYKNGEPELKGKAKTEMYEAKRTLKTELQQYLTSLINSKPIQNPDILKEEIVNKAEGKYGWDNIGAYITYFENAVSAKFYDEITTSFLSVMREKDDIMALLDEKWLSQWEVKKLKKEAANLSQKFDEALRRETELLQQIDEVKEESAKSTAKLSQDNSELEQEILVLKQEIDQKNSLIKQLEKQVQDLQDENDAQLQTITDAQATIAQLEAEIQDHKKEILDLSAQLSQAELQYKNAEEDRDTLADQLKEKERTLNFVENTLEQKAEKYRQERNAYVAQVGQLSSDLEKLQDATGLQAADVEKMKLELAGRKNRLLEDKKLLSDQNNKITQLQVQIANLKEEKKQTAELAKQFETQLQQKTDAYNQLVNKIQEEEKQSKQKNQNVEKLRKDAASAQAKIAAKEITIKKLQEKLLKVSSGVVSDQDRYKDLLEEIQQLKQENNDLSSKASQIQLERDDLETQVVKLKREIKTLKAIKSRLTGVKSALIDSLLGSRVEEARKKKRKETVLSYLEKAEESDIDYGALAGDWLEKTVFHGFKPSIVLKSFVITINTDPVTVEAQVGDSVVLDATPYLPNEVKHSIDLDDKSYLIRWNIPDKNLASELKDYNTSKLQFLADNPANQTGVCTASIFKAKSSPVALVANRIGDEIGGEKDYVWYFDIVFDLQVESSEEDKVNRQEILDLLSSYTFGTSSKKTVQDVLFEKSYPRLLRYVETFRDQNLELDRWIKGVDSSEIEIMINLKNRDEAEEKVADEHNVLAGLPEYQDDLITWIFETLKSQADSEVKRIRGILPTKLNKTADAIRTLLLDSPVDSPLDETGKKRIIPAGWVPNQELLKSLSEFTALLKKSGGVTIFMQSLIEDVAVDNKIRPSNIYVPELVKIDLLDYLVDNYSDLIEINRIPVEQIVSMIKSSKAFNDAIIYRDLRSKLQIWYQALKTYTIASALFQRLLPQFRNNKDKALEAYKEIANLTILRQEITKFVNMHQNIVFDESLIAVLKSFFLVPVQTKPKIPILLPGSKKQGYKPFVASIRMKDSSKLDIDLSPLGEGPFKGKQELLVETITAIYDGLNGILNSKEYSDETKQLVKKMLQVLAENRYNLQKSEEEIENILGASPQAKNEIEAVLNKVVNAVRKKMEKQQPENESDSESESDEENEEENNEEEENDIPSSNKTIAVYYGGGKEEKVAKVVQTFLKQEFKNVSVILKPQEEIVLCDLALLVFITGGRFAPEEKQVQLLEQMALSANGNAILVSITLGASFKGKPQTVDDQLARETNSGIHLFDTRVRYFASRLFMPFAMDSLLPKQEGTGLLIDAVREGLQ